MSALPLVFTASNIPTLQFRAWKKAVRLSLSLSVSLVGQETRLIYKAFASVLIPGEIKIGLGRF